MLNPNPLEDGQFTQHCTHRLAHTKSTQKGSGSIPNQQDVPAPDTDEEATKNAA